MFIHMVGEAARIEDTSLQGAVYEVNERPGHQPWFSFQRQPQRCGEHGSMAQHVRYKGEWSLLAPLCTLASSSFAVHQGPSIFLYVPFVLLPRFSQPVHVP